MGFLSEFFMISGIWSNWSIKTSQMDFKKHRSWIICSIKYFQKGFKNHQVWGCFLD